MNPIVYSSTDVSAPVYTAQNGSLVNLLTKVLVDGYGAKAPLGWSKPYASGDKAVFQTPLGTQQRCLRIDDGNVVPGANATVAAAVGYEEMSSVDAGEGPFPTPAQSAFGVGVCKGTSVGSTPVPWVIVGDEACFYLFALVNAGSRYQIPHFFGEIVPFKPGDAFASALIGVGGTTSHVNSFGNLSESISTTHTNKWIARSWSQLGGAVGFSTGGFGINGSMGTGGMAFPAPHDNGLYISEQVSGRETGVIRGLMPGLYYPLHARPLANFAVRTDVTNHPGKSFMFFDLSPNGNSAGGQCCLDITGPWR